MMAETYSAVVTNLGTSLIEDAYNNSSIVNITQMAIGDSNGAYVEPNPAFTSLVNELGREDIHESSTVGHLIHVYVYVTSKFAGETIREFGLYDDANNLVVYAAYPESLVPDAASGEYIQLEIECIVDLENAEVVNIVVNPIYPHATELEAGIAKIVSEADVDNDEEDSKFLTIKKLLKRAATTVKAGVARFSTSAEAINGTDVTTMLNPSTGLALLKSRISSALDGTRTDYSASESALNQVNTKAVNAQSTADSAQETADAAIPQVGGSTITNQDWNTLTSPGAYAVSSASGNNRPSAYNYGTLFVLNTKATIVQLYHTDTAGQILMRTKYSTNVWGEWVHIGGVSQSPNSAMRLGDSNLNTFDGSASYTTAQFGFFYQDVSAKATAESNYPEQEPGTLIVTKSAMTGGAGCVQTYITRSNNIYTRSKYVAWSEWVKVYSTKNKPTPDDVGALTGQTVVSSFKNPGSWLKIATAYLPSSSSVAKIEVYGGNGFNSGLDYQSTRHQIIVRAGNTQGTGNCRLYTESSRGCPFDGVGFVHTGGSQFDIYAKSKTAYGVNVLVEYASTHGITPKNEAATETPTNLYEGDVVEDYNSFNPPTLANIGIEHIGKSVVGNEADEESIDIAGTSYYLTKYVTSYDPNSLIINSTATTGIAEIKHDGYYLLRYTVNRLRPSDGATIQNGYIEINGDFVAQNKAVSNNYATAAIVTEYYGALLAGDLIRYLTQGSSLAEGGSFSIEYKRPLSEAEKLLVKPQRAIEVKKVNSIIQKQGR
ncbi:hypothetical protein CGK40_16645 [Vibrio parahaemolyticus]|uniref:phage tail-collar fiber domain-containing protein n=1 Tax=Vibrio parahaemolyticus TaxID=670 RepID=UPI00111EE7CE|nr:phage tail protein [Vibrio parahaemolyticus]TNZ95086.1 hypothetical protein CGK40_16645 [Vibrio parahaemolyticus]